MDRFGAYILSVGAAALIVGILTGSIDSKSASGVLVRMACGLFLAFTVIKPVGNIDFARLPEMIEHHSQMGEAAAAMGKAGAENALREIIKEETETYILDKAGSYNAQLEVEVTVSGGETPVPESVYIRGAVSPYARLRIQQILSEELGIPKEQQLWIG